MRGACRNSITGKREAFTGSASALRKGDKGRQGHEDKGGQQEEHRAIGTNHAASHAFYQSLKHGSNPDLMAAEMGPTT